MPGDQSGLLIPSDSNVPVISDHQSPFEVDSKILSSRVWRAWVLLWLTYGIGLLFVPCSNVHVRCVLSTFVGCLAICCVMVRLLAIRRDLLRLGAVVLRAIIWRCAFRLDRC